MEDAFLNEPLTKKQSIKCIDGYVDYYLDTLAWFEGQYDQYWTPTYATHCSVEGVQYL